MGIVNALNKQSCSGCSLHEKRESRRMKHTRLQYIENMEGRQLAD
jgi:hypothetical protein